MKTTLIALCGAAFLSGGAFAADQTASDTTTAKPKHHSLAKGAAAGAVGGHFVGKGHAKSGAVVGAAVQHHKNKKEEKAAEKGE